jgi:hypothetical protein
MFFLLACAMLAPLVPDRTGTNMIVAHLFIAGVAIMIFVGVMNMNRDR